MSINRNPFDETPTDPAGNPFADQDDPDQETADAESLFGKIERATCICCVCGGPTIERCVDCDRYFCQSHSYAAEDFEIQCHACRTAKNKFNVIVFIVILLGISLYGLIKQFR